MKIGDIEIGEHYGAVDEPAGSRTSFRNPREIEVLDIVRVEEAYFSTGGFLTGKRAVRQVRRVQIKILDEPNGRLDWGEISTAKKNAVLVVEARKIVGKWSDIVPGIRVRVAEEQRRIALEESIKARLKAVGFKKFGWGDVLVSVREKRVEVTFDGASVYKLLDLLEGKS